MDPIVKNELARSIGVFSITLIFFCILFVTGIVAMPGYAPFILAFVATALIFLVLVWYGKHYPAGKIFPSFHFWNKPGEFLTLLIIYSIFMAIWIKYPIIGILWPLLLVLIGFFLVNIVFKNGEHYQVTLPGWLFFYIVVSSLVAIHDLISGIDLLSTLIFIAILGIISVVIGIGYSRISGNARVKNVKE